MFLRCCFTSLRAIPSVKAPVFSQTIPIGICHAVRFKEFVFLTIFHVHLGHQTQRLGKKFRENVYLGCQTKARVERSCPSNILTWLIRTNRREDLPKPVLYAVGAFTVSVHIQWCHQFNLVSILEGRKCTLDIAVAPTCVTLGTGSSWS